MWELICHHTYKWDGLPIDLSIYNSHGVATDTIFVADASEPGSGAVRFAPPAGRIRLPTSPAWKPLVALRIEAIVKLTEPSPNPHTIIAGDEAFKLFVDGTVLRATFRGEGISSGLDTSVNAVTYPGYRVAFDKWTELAFVHDGLSRACLYADGAIVAEHNQVPCPVQAVGPGGVSIGNAVHTNNEGFGGDIDEIRVFRDDPHAVRDQFLDRPFDKATADCWAEFLLALRAALAKYPDCARQLKQTLRRAFTRFDRAIDAKGPETRARYARVREQYVALWRSGQIDSPAMAKLVADWCTWLRLVELNPGDDAELRELAGSECWRLITGELKSRMNCDQQFIALLRMIKTECDDHGRP